MSAAVPSVLLLAAVGMGSGEGAAPLRLDRLEPAVVATHSEVVLTLVGCGFETGATVRIESVTPGRYLRYQPDTLTPGRCELRLALGFGRSPAQRRVYLENPDGRRTEPRILEIRAVDGVSGDGLRGGVEESSEPGDSNAAPEGDGVEEGVTPSGASDVVAQTRPVVHRLYPAEVPAGRPLVLEVHGESFARQSTVWVTANVHAGSSRLPEYELRAFPTVYVDSELLEVEFDRGFYPLPGARDVLVESAGGLRSAPVVMAVGAPEER